MKFKMVRILCLFLLLIFASAGSIAQTQLDSLLYEYKNQIGSKKIETGIRISSYYDNDNLFKSLEYANEVLAFAQEFGTANNLLTAYNRLGIVFYKLGDLSKSNDNFLEAVRLVNQLGSDSKSIESRLMNNIANNYDELKRSRLAIKYYKKSLVLKRQMSDSARYSITLNNMALAYSNLKYYDSAYTVLRDALAIDVLLNDKVSEAYSNGSLGEVFLHEKEADSATFYLNQSLMFFTKIPDTGYVLAYYHQKLGEVGLITNQLEQAHNHFKKALNFALEVGAKPIEKDCYKGLEMVAMGLGNFEKAYEYSQLYAQLQDTLYKTESAQKLNAIETSYQIKNKEQEISILSANAQVNEYKLYAAAAIIFLVIILLGFMYYRYLFKARANQVLKQKNNTIEKQNKEIMDSVEYAKGIQEAILPEFSSIESIYNSAYLYYKPSQVVSGDFYWADEINENIILVLADGTGHGVPGAFLSVMGTSLLKQIITEDKICKPDEILKKLNNKVREGLGQSKLGSSLKDGMDVAVCTYNKRNKRLSFAGAKRPMILKKGNELEVIKGSRNSVGGALSAGSQYDIHFFDLEKGDAIVFFTDGIVDQFGGTENKKFLTKRLLNVFEKSNGINGIKLYFEEEMKEWQGSREQTDDMLLLAVEI
ncbi:MAG: SpoIIE family protein phosphatase [Cyclobacteriaceae bacterium]|nr:SpoIIE family protein phosphatase [Cyclobacteriaceae bacterium]